MKRNAAFFTAVAALLLTGIVLIGAVIRIQEHGEEKEREARYLQLEQEYLDRMREVLKEEGFADSGVMLTRTVYEDERREYCIAIHHGRFGGLSEQEKEALVRELENVSFEEEDCSFIYSLTGNA